MNLRTIDGWHFDASPSEKPDSRPPVVVVRKRRAPIEVFHSIDNETVEDSPRRPRVFRMPPSAETVSHGTESAIDSAATHDDSNAANAESISETSVALPVPRIRRRSRSGKGYTVFMARQVAREEALDAEWHRLSTWADAIARDIEAALDDCRRSAAQR